VVERGPEKAGVGGSIPSLATTSAHRNHSPSGPRSGLARRASVLLAALRKAGVAVQSRPWAPAPAAVQARGFVIDGVECDNQQ
jgi:hypothetical protein